MWWAYNQNSGDTGGIVMNGWQVRAWRCADTCGRPTCSAAATLTALARGVQVSAALHHNLLSTFACVPHTPPQDLNWEKLRFMTSRLHLTPWHVGARDMQPPPKVSSGSSGVCAPAGDTLLCVQGTTAAPVSSQPLNQHARMVVVQTQPHPAPVPPPRAPVLPHKPVKVRALHAAVRAMLAMLVHSRAALQALRRWPTAC
jgi:hypothetical protein